MCGYRLQRESSDGCDRPKCGETVWDMGGRRARITPRNRVYPQAAMRRASAPPLAPRAEHRTRTRSRLILEGDTRKTSRPPPPMTTDAGHPVDSDEHSLTVGPDGPILLQDHYAIEQMAQWDRERVPERQPHAKGSGAFGRFEVTGDVSRYTKAAVFQPKTTTDLAARFSAVAGERGSPDTWRDPRSQSSELAQGVRRAIQGTRVNYRPLDEVSGQRRLRTIQLTR